jgi:hypothetical protein
MLSFPCPDTIQWGDDMKSKKGDLLEYVVCVDGLNVVTSRSYVWIGPWMIMNDNG